MDETAPQNTKGLFKTKETTQLEERCVRGAAA